VHGASLIQSTHGSPGNLEVVAVAGSRSSHLSSTSGGTAPAGTSRRNSVAGGPALPPIGQPGFIEARRMGIPTLSSAAGTAPRRGGVTTTGLACVSRCRRSPTFPTPNNYFQVSLIQSHYGPHWGQETSRLSRGAREQEVYFSRTARGGRREEGWRLTLQINCKETIAPIQI
jgi:hypothetical protein